MRVTGPPVSLLPGIAASVPTVMVAPSTDAGRVDDVRRRALADCPLLDGRLLEDVELAVGDVLVAHGLGRVPRGWFVVRAQDAAADVYEAAVDADFLTLTSGSAATVALWVF